MDLSLNNSDEESRDGGAGAKRKAGEAVTPNPKRRRGEPDERTSGTTATTSAFDLVIPPIKEPNEKDILANFVFKELTPCEGTPNYNSLTQARTEQTKNDKSVFFKKKSDPKK